MIVQTTLGAYSSDLDLVLEEIVVVPYTQGNFMKLARVVEIGERSDYRGPYKHVVRIATTDDLMHATIPHNPIAKARQKAAIAEMREIGIDEWRRRQDEETRRVMDEALESGDLDKAERCRIVLDRR